LVTTLLRNPTMPIAGGATRAVDAAAGVAATVAAVWVVSALLVVLACTVCAVSAALDSVTVADDCVSPETTWLASTVLVDAEGVVAFTVAGCVEFDSVSGGLDITGSASGAWVAGGVLGSVGSVVSPEPVGSLVSGGVSTPLVSSSGSVLVGAGAAGASDSVVLVCAPPLLLMVTPEATCSDDDVVPDDVVLPDEVESAPVDVAPVAAVDEPAVPVDDVAADSVDDSPADVSLDVEFAELVDDDSEDVSVVSAAAKPGEVTTMTPIPRAAANAPTRPTWRL
jgi:hypothetical protein